MGLGATVHGAGGSDSRGGRRVLIRRATRRITCTALVGAGGYQPGGLAGARDRFGFALTGVNRPEAGVKVVPKCGSVDRFFAWLHVDRRHAKA